MKIYLSGPIAGHDNFEKVFALAQKNMQYLGHEVVNPTDIAPHNHGGECPKSYVAAKGHSAACYLRTDLKALLDCDAVFMMNGWENSIGARLEFSVAAHCGLYVYYDYGQVPLGEQLND
jgi:hypothetical protein